MTVLIIETDIFDDVDDVGALALAHALADAGELEIAAVCVNTQSRWGAVAARVVNRAFGRPGIPVGAFAHADDSVAHNDFARRLVEREGTRDDWAAIRPAAEVWRDVLDAAADDSLTLVSLGFYGNLVALLDTVDPELLRRRIRRAAVMGGRYPSGVEFNFAADPDLTARFLADWPTPIDLLGWEAGAGVETGRGLSMSGRSDPVSFAYRTFCGPDSGRPSWDPLTVALGVDPGGWGLELSEAGRVVVESDGSDLWHPDPAGTMRYVREIGSPDALAARIDGLLERAIDGRAAARRD